MPRPAEQEEVEGKKDCRINTRLERILICVTTIGILIVIVLLVLIAKKQSDFRIKYCNTTICLLEASRITDYIDPSVNPCDDFYQFSCGNFLKNAHGDEKLAPQPLMQAQAIRELFEAYIEPIHGDDHKMVKMAKNLFRACMNESEIESDGLKTIKEVLKAAGGWPVLEGSSWNETNFDWVRASYKLRELGYHYSAFLELKVEIDKEDKTKYIFEVATPYMWDYSSRNFDKIEFMTDVAEIFGVEDTARATMEMGKAHELLIQLQMEIHNRYGLGSSSKFRVKDYQMQCGAINWLEFINTISGRAAQITENDSVVFLPPESLTSWINLLSQTPKRIQANYLMWKVIEATFPYLTAEFRNRDPRNRKPKSREDFCLEEIQERFIPSPIDVICDRRYMPKAKKDLVEELLKNIKTEFIEQLNRIQWIDGKDKQKTIEEANSITDVIAAPENYFDNKILDDLDVDMIETKNNTFLSLLAQANRNQQTAKFSKIKKLVSENFYEEFYIMNSGGTIVYSEAANLLYVPVVSSEYPAYKENRSNYLNYGALGTHIASQYGAVLVKHLRGNDTYVGKDEGWSNLTKEKGQTKLQCIEKELENHKLKLNSFNADFILLQMIGDKIAREAYAKLAKSKGEEQHLIGIEYTPQQLFWISAMSTYCQPLNPYGDLPSAMREENVYGNVFSGSMRNNPQFAIDFNCPAGSKMNPSSRCQIF